MNRKRSFSSIVNGSSIFFVTSAFAMDVPPVSVPEPGILSAIAISAAALALLYRSRRK